MPKKATQSFEKILNELEDIVNTLEAEELSLEDAMDKFEQGVKLSTDCQKALSDAETKVQILIDKNLKDFDKK